MRRTLPVLLLLVVAGCLANPTTQHPRSAADAHPRPKPDIVPAERQGISSVEAGAPDTVLPVPGNETAAYAFRFVQSQPPSDRFTFQDRDLSFYFRPAPDALHFQVENRQGQPVWMEWDRCVFYAPLGGSSKVAHQDTRFEDRLKVSADTQIGGLQRYSDYLLPIDLLLDPAGGSEQLHKPLLYEDTRAPQYSDHEFGVDLVFRVQNQPRTYAFRFRVASVIAR
jgi:hypothetical protein